MFSFKTQTPCNARVFLFSIIQSVCFPHPSPFRSFCPIIRPLFPHHCSFEIYLPGMPPCAMAAFCSWNLSPSLSELLRNLSTQRMTQPSSLLSRDLELKSWTQSVKQRWTRFEYIYATASDQRLVPWVSDSRLCWDLGEGRWMDGLTYVHEVLHLLALHAALQLALLGGVQPVR